MDEPRNRLSEFSPYGFNFHHQIKQGYTNNGQVLGTPFANGGNSQTISFILYHPKGNITLYLNRNNPDNTFSFSNPSNIGKYSSAYKAVVSSGISFTQFILPTIFLDGGFIFDYIINSSYFSIDNEGKVSGTKDKKNINITIGLKYIL